MGLLRFLGVRELGAGRDAIPESLLELERELDAAEPEEARFVAAFAYLLARVAGADLRIEPSECAEIARHLVDFGGLSPDRADLVARSALRAAETHGASDDHLVARAFRDLAEPSERIQLLRCLYAVAAADEIISTREDNEIFEVGREIGASREDVVGLRAEFREYLGSLRALPGER